MKVRIGSFYLSAGDKESPNGLTVEESRSPQVVEGLRWKQVKVYDRNNKRTTVSFSVTRLWPTLGAAESYMIKHGILVPSQGDVQFMLDDGSSLWLPDAECTTTNSKHTGLSTMHSYSLVGGIILTTQQYKALP